MKTEKSALCYHGVPQVQRCFELLAPFCAKAFVSIRAEQQNLAELKRYPQIRDQFEGRGPIVGILSAIKTYLKVAWFVLACDLPWIEKKTIATLVERRNILKIATAFCGSDGLPEPLCAIYEPSSRETLTRIFQSGRRSPRQALIESDVELIAPANPRWLQNVNDPEERERALADLNQRAKQRHRHPPPAP